MNHKKQRNSRRLEEGSEYQGIYFENINSTEIHTHILIL